jgi:hypothetical protein
MGFFRSKTPDSQMGVRIDIGDLNREIAQGTRMSIPWDGRYLVTMVETNGQDVHRLLWEEAATYHEVKNLLGEFRKTHGKCENASSVRIDDVSGVWMAAPRGRPIAAMTVWHPVTFEHRDDDHIAALEEGRVGYKIDEFLTKVIGEDPPRI